MARFHLLLPALAAALPAFTEENPPPAQDKEPSPRQASQATPGELLAKLDHLKVTLEFRDTPLADVVDFIRDVAAVNILIDASVRDRYGADPVKVTLSVKDLPLRSALNLVLEPRGLTLRYRDGVLMVMTGVEANKDLNMEVYDVRDLLMPIRDFPGPEISLASFAEGKAGVVIAPEEGPPPITEDFIVEMVKKHCGKDTWDVNPKTSANLHNGLLIVTQTPAVHKQVRELLGKLQANK